MPSHFRRHRMDSDHKLGLRRAPGVLTLRQAVGLFDNRFRARNLSESTGPSYATYLGALLQVAEEANPMPRGADARRGCGPDS